MSFIELILGVVFTVALGTGINLTTAGASANEFWWARICYIVAAFALLAAYVWWLNGAIRPQPLRLILGSIVGALILAGTPELLWWTNIREAAFLAAHPSSSRIVVSKFVIKPIDPAKPDNGYEIDLYMVNRGIIPGYAPLMNYSFNSVDGFLSEADVDAEMAKLQKLASEKSPTTGDNREEIEVGVENNYVMLSSGLTADAWKRLASGEKRFYLFVVLTFTDDNLPAGQYWISEFCASQGKDFSYFQKCPGHNRTWLYK